MALAKSALLFTAVLGGAAILGGAARADTTVVAPGAVLDMSADLVLSGSDSLTAGADGGARCTIHGNGKTIRSADGWTGSLTIKSCDVDRLGASDTDAVNVSSAAAGAYIITDTAFSASGQLIFALGGDRGMTFQRNLIAQDSVVSAVVALESSVPSVYIIGQSTPQKLFQGNVVLHSRVQFQATNNWLVGGLAAGEGNVLSGTRVGFDFDNVSDSQVIGNFSHTTIPELGWNQVKNLTGGGSNLDIQHNVLWGFNWLLEVSVKGEVSYNLLIDDVERGWALLRDKAGSKVHHNLLIATKDSQFGPEAAFVINLSTDRTSTDQTEVFNNTFSGGGVCVPAVRGLVLIDEGALASLRSNAFIDARVPAGTGGLIRGTQLDYTDYNLFYLPDSPQHTVYALDTVTRTTGAPGFGAHDVTSAGKAGQPAIPLFADKIPRAFPFVESEVIGRQTTVCQILAYYRKVYTPVASAGMLRAGDPADGANNSIGAIGVGADDPLDLFGRAASCDASDIGHPATDASLYTCPTVPLIVKDPTMVNPDLSHGFMCVCDAGAGAGRRGATPLLPIIALAGVALAARPRRRDRR